MTYEKPTNIDDLTRFQHEMEAIVQANCTPKDYDLLIKAKKLMNTTHIAFIAISGLLPPAAFDAYWAAFTAEVELMNQSIQSAKVKLSPAEKSLF